MITWAVAWYARSREEFDGKLFIMAGLLDVLIVVVITTAITTILADLSGSITIN